VPELDPRGARGLAGAAADAVVHRFCERRIVDAHLSALHRAHEADPAAWVRALERGQRERRAGRQAEAALDAAREAVAGGIDGRRDRRQDGRVQASASA
jgi:hypothetical protein